MKIHEKSATMKSLQQQQNRDLETTHRSYATRRLKRLWQTFADLHRLAKTCIDLHDTFTHLLSQYERVLQDLE